MDYTLNGRSASPNGSRHPLMAPHGIYPCVPDGELDKWISIAVATDGEWQSLCNLMQQPELVCDPRFADRFERQRHSAELDQLIAAWTAQFEQYELMAVLQQHSVAAMPCLDQEGRYFNEQLAARECYVSVDHPVLGTEPLYGIPMKLSETPGSIRGPAPRIGQHTEAICAELLGLSRERIDELVAEKVLF
jgi:crotonobetainyl-CoA:carnitine CoA-transferase CaiB-like acyl-CoA transferase